jgi:hypothetical protein
VGDAVGQRNGRAKGTSMKDLKKEMDKYLQTGRHSEVEAARRRRAEETIFVLPVRNVSQPHVFLDITAGKQLLGGFCCGLTDESANKHAGEQTVTLRHVVDWFTGWIADGHTVDRNTPHWRVSGWLDTQRHFRQLRR